MNGTRSTILEIPHQKLIYKIKGNKLNPGTFNAQNVDMKQKFLKMARENST